MGRGKSSETNIVVNTLPVNDDLFNLFSVTLKDVTLTFSDLQILRHFSVQNKIKYINK